MKKYTIGVVLALQLLSCASANKNSQSTLNSVFVQVYNDGGPIYLWKKANGTKELSHSDNSDNVEFLEYAGGKYVKVKKAQKVGYVYVYFFSYDSASVAIINKYNIKNNGPIKLLYASHESLNKSNTNTPKPTYSNGSEGRSTTYKSIQTGPRGGQYYINKNGNKTYIKKK